jgi:hypothetical protein
METSVKSTSTNPTERAKELWHTFYKKENHNFFTAKDDAMTLIDTYLKESRFGNHLEAVNYWEEVKAAMIKL